MESKRPFVDGARAILPILMGVIPFGMVMGTVAANAKLTLLQTLSMDTLVYAGASQLAATGLMTQGSSVVVVVLTGLLINARFFLYSAAMSPHLRHSRFITKLFASYSLTDQSFTAMAANNDRLKTASDHVQFYLGSAVVMLVAWRLSVLGGFIFGNLIPPSLSLDYAVPLSFVGLLLPTLKDRTYVAVALFSGLLAIALAKLPFNSGLIFTALSSVILAAVLSTYKRRSR